MKCQDPNCYLSAQHRVTVRRRLIVLGTERLSTPSLRRLTQQTDAMSKRSRIIGHARLTPSGARVARRLVGRKGPRAYHWRSIAVDSCAPLLFSLTSLRTADSQTSNLIAFLLAAFKKRDVR